MIDIPLCFHWGTRICDTNNVDNGEFNCCQMLCDTFVVKIYAWKNNGGPQYWCLDCIEFMADFKMKFPNEIDDDDYGKLPNKRTYTQHQWNLIENDMTKHFRYDIDYSLLLKAMLCVKPFIEKHHITQNIIVSHCKNCDNCFIVFEKDPQFEKRSVQQYNYVPNVCSKCKAKQNRIKLQPHP